METTERRMEILRILRRRRHETISNLAYEFGVSTRTILRDIEMLSISEPIYTQCGRYGGGVYISEDYCEQINFMTKKELSVLQKLSELADKKAICELNNEEKRLLKSIISQYARVK